MKQSQEESNETKPPQFQTQIKQNKNKQKNINFKKSHIQDVIPSQDLQHSPTTPIDLKINFTFRQKKRRCFDIFNMQNALTIFLHNQVVELLCISQSLSPPFSCFFIPQQYTMICILNEILFIFRYKFPLFYRKNKSFFLKKKLETAKLIGRHDKPRGGVN
jgi:Holliday junction resolvase RusA-like endonuclease